MNQLKRNSTIRYYDGWDGPSSVTRFTYTTNKPKGPQKSQRNRSQGIYTSQISPSPIFSIPFSHQRKRNNSTSNRCPEILSPGYCHHQNPQHDRRNIQIHCNQAVWKLVQMVNIPYTNKHQEKNPGRNTTRRQKKPGVFIRVIITNKSICHNKENQLLQVTFKSAIPDVSKSFWTHLRSNLTIYSSVQKYPILQRQIWG